MYMLLSKKKKNIAVLLDWFPIGARCNATWLNSAEDEYGTGGVGLLGKILPFPGHNPTEFTELGLGIKLGGEEEM